MGTFGACITASVTPINGNGVATSGSFLSGSEIWDWMKFEMTHLTSSTLTSYTASLNIISGAVSNVNLLIVGGGAGGSTTGSIYPLGSSIAYTVDSASPGGGGGIVYYNNLTLSPGTYEIGVGAAAQKGTPDGTNAWTGSNGNDSYFTYSYPFPQFNIPKFTAYGGGFGGAEGWYRRNSDARYFYYRQYGNSTSLDPNNNTLGKSVASAGGNSIPNTVGQPGVSSMHANVTNNSDGLGGFNPTNQGNSGGFVGAGDPIDGWNGYYSSGAGGAGGVGQSVGSGSGVPYTTKVGDGGAGVTYNISGSAVVLSGGGAGRAITGITVQTGTRGSTSYGAGGNAYIGYSAGDTNSIGNAGLVYIEWQRCFDQRCKTYSITTDFQTASISYYPCGNSSITSSTFNTFTTTTFCADYFTNGTPIVTAGSGSLTLLNNCLTYNIPIPIPVPTQSVDYLIVAGGGGGGWLARGGGGGAGGMLTGSKDLISSSYTIIVGNSGSGGTSSTTEATPGENSTAFNLTTYGGGAGRSGDQVARNGGSGAGAGYYSPGNSLLGGNGVGGQGYNGGNAISTSNSSGGGGGAGQAGFSVTAGGAGAGGSGSQWLNGNWYAAGGGGGAIGSGTSGSGGYPNGGKGAGLTNAYPPTTGSINTGAGGGAGGAASQVQSGKDGGNGVVIIRYFGSGSKAIGGTISYSGSYTYHTFNSSSTFSII